MVFTMNPKTFGGEPFTGCDGGKGTNDGNEVAPTFGFNFQDSETALLAEEGDTFNEARNDFNGLWSGLFDEERVTQEKRFCKMNSGEGA